jgi:hypothetical protein
LIGDSSLQNSQTTDPPLDTVDPVVDPASAGPERSLSIGERLRRPQTIISFLVAFAIIFFVFRNLDINLGEIWTNFKAANFWWIGLGFVAYYGCFPLRAIRWRYLLGNAGISPATGYPVPGVSGLSQMFILSWFANCLVPAKLGDAYRGYLLKKHAHPSFARTMGTIFAERAMDVFALVGLMLAASLLVFHGNVPGSVQAPVYAGFGLVTVGIIGLVGLFVFGERVRLIVPERVRPYYVRIEEGIVQSFARHALLQVVLCTLGIWALEGVRVYSVASAFNVNLTPAESMFVALLASLLTVLPFTPAGLGVVEGGTIIALKLLNVSATDAATIALVDRGIAYWSVILIGAVVYLFSRYK